MNNEPVAWMVNDKAYQDIFEAEHYSKFTNKPMIPLYTHPAKTLTDEEIIEICQLIGIDPTSEYIWQFARVILRKAQEK
jgi:hypothetical protein